MADCEDRGSIQHAEFKHMAYANYQNIDHDYFKPRKSDMEGLEEALVPREGQTSTTRALEGLLTTLF